MDNKKNYFYQYLRENKNFMCWFLFDTYKDYKYRTKSFEGKPFNIHEIFKDYDQRYDIMIYALEVNQFLVNAGKRENYSVTLMNKLLFDYINSWLLDKDDHVSKIRINGLARSMLFICGFYLKLKPSLDFTISEALGGFEREIKRLEASKIERMRSMELPEAFRPYYCHMFEMIEKDNRGTLLNFTLRNGKFDFNEQTRSLIFYSMLANEFFKLSWKLEDQSYEFIQLLYDIMQMLDIFNEEELNEEFGINYQFRNMRSRIYSFLEEEKEIIDSYLLRVWRAYYNS